MNSNDTKLSFFCREKRDTHKCILQ